MSAHGPHFDQPDYDERQVLHDGCAECEHRGADVKLALAHMDPATFGRAFIRALDWQLGRATDLRISRAEAPTLEAIYAVTAKLAEAGIVDPLAVLRAVVS